MSGRYLVMPRGINVGGRNRVPMSELRSKLTEAGYVDPVTILQSGNVILTSSCTDVAALSSSMEKLMADEFGVNVPCLARTAAQVEAALELNPLRGVAGDGSRYLVNFLSEEPAAEAVRSLLEVSWEPEVIHVEGSEAYVWTPEGVKAMRLSHSYLERHFGLIATARNWNTLKKIAARF